jgi:hypothetical protein
MAKEGCHEMDRLMAALRTQIPGVTDDLLQLNLFNVIDRHLRKTNAWRYISQVAIERGVKDYPIFPPAGTSMVRVLEAEHGGRPVAQATGGTTTSGQRGRLIADETWEDQDAGYYADEQHDNESGIFQYAIFYPNYVSLTIPPSEQASEAPMNLVMAITLAQGCMDEDCGEWTLEPWMWDRYHDDWLNGMLGAMFGMHAKPWSNPQRAMFHEKRFYSLMSFARQEAHRGFVFDRPMWRFPRAGGWIKGASLR